MLDVPFSCFLSFSKKCWMSPFLAFLDVPFSCFSCFCPRFLFCPLFLFACVHGALDHAEPGWILRWRSTQCCLPKVGSRRRSEPIRFRGSIPSPHVLLSTLRRRPRGRQRMTRSRCGSLDLHRMKLSFTTPHLTGFCRRTRPRIIRLASCSAGLNRSCPAQPVEKSDLMGRAQPVSINPTLGIGRESVELIRRHILRRLHLSAATTGHCVLG